MWRSETNSTWGPRKRKTVPGLKARIAARERFAEAKSAFQVCEAYSQAAADEDAELMARGWVLLMDQLLGEAGAEAELEAVIAKLQASGDDGEFYAGQYER